MARILYTSYYKDKNEARQAELLECLDRNIKCKWIDHVVILLEGKAEEFDIPKSDKIKIVECKRPTYRDFFDLANAVSKEGDYSIIANSDIYFDRSIRLIRMVDMSNTCIALSRWHYYNKKRIELHNEQYSQDVWIFRGKIKPVGYCDFTLGIAGCDNRIAHELARAGYKMFNPAKDIKTIHLHVTEVRNYNQNHRIQKPYLPVPVTNLHHVPELKPIHTGSLLNVTDWRPKSKAEKKKTILKTW